MQYLWLPPNVCKVILAAVGILHLSLSHCMQDFHVPLKRSPRCSTLWDKSDTHIYSHAFLVKTLGDVLASNMAAVSHFSISSPAGRVFAHPAGISCSVCQDLQKVEEEEEPLMERENRCHSRSGLSRVCRHACPPANGTHPHARIHAC